MTTPKWTDFPKYPVIAGIAALAIAVTIAWWAKVDVNPLFETTDIRRGQLWNKDQEALSWLKYAARYKPKAAEIWFDLGIAYQRVGNTSAAKNAYRKAHELAPAKAEYSDAAKAIE